VTVLVPADDDGVDAGTSELAFVDKDSSVCRVNVMAGGDICE
jgi:hypothetical protein